MNILKILRYTFSPKSYFEEESADFIKTREMLSDEAIRNRFLYKMDEKEKLEVEPTDQSSIDALADKHWKKFKTELTVLENRPVANTYAVLYRIAAAFLFILNPWMIYKTFEKALMPTNISLNSNQPFLLSVDGFQKWKEISIEWTIFIIIFPGILFLLAYFLRRKTKIIPAYYFLLSLSVFFSWGYYVVTDSDSILPIFTAFLIALFGVLFFVFENSYKKEK